MAALSQAPETPHRNFRPIKLKGHVDIIEFNESGEITPFEVMIRPIRALQALGDEMGTGSDRN